jgi:acyl-coenzyme A synthetase/AMP-(fatty) acid ligase
MSNIPSSWPALVLDLAQSAGPDWIALEHGADTLSIRQLADRMSSAATALAGDPAPVLVSSADPLLHTVAVLGARMAGRPALMVDSRVPDDLLVKIFRQSGASAIIGRSVEGLQAIGAEVLDAQATRPVAAQSPHDINTMLLTSGSTGVPKIVQRSVGADMIATQNLKMLGYPLGLGDRYLLMVPFTSVAFITLVMGLITLKATVVFGSFCEDLGQRLEDLRISGAYCVPTMLRLAHSRDNLEGPGWTRLKGLMVGGEHLDLASRQRLARHFPDAFMLYGMTEHPNTAFARAAELEHRPSCVGRLMPGRELRFVLPGTSDEVAPGEEGQLVMRGPEMFAGYVGDKPVGEWFAAGDVGRLDDEGYLYITGRVNDQVNVGGNRVSTVEVSALIDSHPDVIRSAVVPIDDAVWTTKLVAFVVQNRETGLTQEDLVAWLRTQTTAYRVPRKVIFLDSLPMDASGKLSRQTLVKWATEAEAEVDNSP